MGCKAQCEASAPQKRPVLKAYVGGGGELRVRVPFARVCVRTGVGVSVGGCLCGCTCVEKGCRIVRHFIEPDNTIPNTILICCMNLSMLLSH